MGKDVSFQVATGLLGAGIGVSGWLLREGAAPGRIGALLLTSLGVFSLFLGLGEILAGRESATRTLVTELRTGLPALLCGWLWWRGRPLRQIGSALVACWAVSFTIQALAYADAPIDAVVIIARAGVPGLVCAWLLWRGCEVRHIGSVLLISWPVSYLIYALRGEDPNSAIGELLVGLPTIAVGWLLWRRSEPRSLPSPPSPAAAPTLESGTSRQSVIPEET
jgi:hypothetical protein